MMRNDKIVQYFLYTSLLSIGVLFSTTYAQQQGTINKTSNICDQISVIQAPGNNNNQVTVRLSGNYQENITINRGNAQTQILTTNKSISYQYPSTGKKNIIISNNKQPNPFYCEKQVTVTSVRGCMDQYASNYNPNANITASNCLYNFSPLISCQQIDFMTDKKNYQKNELVKFTRNNRPAIKTIRLLIDNQTTLNTPKKPLGRRYKETGKKEPKLMVTTTDGLNTVCETSFIIGKLGCTYQRADNFDPTADINDGSCIIIDEKPFLNIVTKTPYKQGDKKISVRANYNGNHQRIQTTAILSQNEKIIRKRTPQLQKNGQISIPIRYSQGELGYIQEGTYDLAIQMNHYRDNIKAQKKYTIKIGQARRETIQECGNNMIELNEECEGSHLCKDCIVINLSPQQKNIIQQIVTNITKARNIDQLNANNKKKIRKSIDTQTIQSEKILYAVNYFQKMLNTIQ